MNNTIKKILAVSATILGIISITSCEAVDNSAVTLNVGTPEVEEKADEGIYIWTDEDTGVQYIIYRETTLKRDFSGICPRYNPDGSLHVVETTDQDDIEKGGDNA